MWYTYSKYNKVNTILILRSSRRFPQNLYAKLQIILLMWKDKQERQQVQTLHSYIDIYAFDIYIMSNYVNHAVQ